MAQSYSRPDEAITQIVREVAFMTDPGSKHRAFPIAGSVGIPNVGRPPLDRGHQSVHLNDEQNPVFGMKEGSWSLPFFFCPDSTQLVAAASAVTHDLRTLLYAAFGGETASAGSAVEASPAPTTTSFSVGAGHGSRFAVGQWILVEVAGVLEPSKISGISTDAITLDLALSGAPSAAAIVVNMYNNFCAPGSTESLSIDHALANFYATEQWAMNGCIVDSFTLKTDRNAIMTCEFGLKVGTWTYPGTNISSVTVGTGTAGDPWVVKDETCILQAYDATTRTQFPIFGASTTLVTGMTYVESTTGTDGKGQALRTARMVVDHEVKLAGVDEATAMSWWNNQTSLRFVRMFPQGSTTTKRWAVLDTPKSVIREKPMTAKEGGRTLTVIKLRGKMPSTATSGATATDLARSPIIVARG
jgi:hypothetical protein